MPHAKTDELAAAFLDRSLPKASWTHHAHLSVGLWHVLRYDAETSLNLLRERIQKYNEATGVVNGENSGYHETITYFYIQIIRYFLSVTDVSRPVDLLATELAATYGDKDLPLQYYSRERLFSPVARRSRVEPDLKPVFPRSDT